MTPNVSDWFRSLGVFGTAFAAVLVVTMGIAGVIVPTPGGDAQAGDAPPGPSDPIESTPVPTTAARPTTIGGTLAVSGDREGTLVLDRETTQDGYGLVGADGRIIFELGDPVTVRRVQYDGLEFFVEPDDCTVTPGERHDPSGVAGAEIHCPAIDDVRGNGIIGLEGRVGVAADLFGLRGDLPVTGGTLALGDETLTFQEAFLTTGPPRVIGGIPSQFAGQLHDAESGAALALEYDGQSHELSVIEIRYAGDTVVVPTGACLVSENEIGLLNPRTRVVELDISCQALDIPALGSVPLEGTVVAELSEPPR